METMNILPAQRLEQRRRLRRQRRWQRALGVYCAAVAASAGVASTMRPTDGDLLATELAALEGANQELERVLRERRAEESSLKRQLVAASEIGDRPDWSQLVRVVSASLPPDTVLRRFVLDVRRENPGSRERGSRQGGRPEPRTYVLRLEASARTSAGVSEVVSKLEATRLFDSVELLRTSRSGGGGDTLHTFDLECRVNDSAEVTR